MAALEAIEVSSRVRVLVRRVLFGPGKPNAVALARMLRIKRPLSAALPARLCGKCQTDSSTVASSMRATGSTQKMRIKRHRQERSEPLRMKFVFRTGDEHHFDGRALR